MASTRSQRIASMLDNKNDQMKRGAELTGKDLGEPKRKRAAFGDITNATSKTNQNAKKIGKKVVQKGNKKTTKMLVAVPKPSSNNKTSSTLTSSQQEKAEVSWDIIELSQGSQQSTQGSSQGLSSSQESVSSSSSDDSWVDSQNKQNQGLTELLPVKEEEEAEQKPEWTDIDAENYSDIVQVGCYAAFIFNYYKEREASFPIMDYLSAKQPDLTANMRAILVDWLVEVQENFELNHETLYLAVKLVDLYLCKKTITKDALQLVGATALFIACKFDERCPPLLDDFLYICDDAYQRREMIRTEMDILNTIGFDLGIPLSYRFLRRYAKCAKANMETLTLGRFILEMALTEYKFTQQRDSQVAAAALLLAMKMKNCGNWDATLEHYTGYKESELVSILSDLNSHIAAPPNKNLTTIRAKYSHKVFHEVALISPLTTQQIEELKNTSNTTL